MRVPLVGSRGPDARPPAPRAPAAPAPGLTLLPGYNGRGAALATLVGANLVQPADHLLPLPITDLHSIPLHSMHRLYATAILQIYRLFDHLAVR